VIKEKTRATFDMMQFIKRSAMSKIEKRTNGNMEMRLNRSFDGRRLWPFIDWCYASNPLPSFAVHPNGDNSNNSCSYANFSLAV
jgi:hypothetical protein